MNRSELIAAVAERISNEWYYPQTTKKDAGVMVDTIVDIISKDPCIWRKGSPVWIWYS